MSWQEVTVIAVGAFQVVALAWLAAWQQRSRREVSKINTKTDELLNGTSASRNGA